MNESGYRSLITGPVNENRAIFISQYPQDKRK